MNVTLRQLQAFTGVYRTRSITRAARELGITQSAASLLIQQLEAQLGVKLFDRSTRSVQPTLAADEAVHAAERMLGDALGLSRRMRDLAQARAGRVAFLASAGTASALLPSVLAKFRAGYPDIEIDMRDVAADDLVPRPPERHRPAHPRLRGTALTDMGRIGSDADDRDAARDADTHADRSGAGEPGQAPQPNL
jgi:DNA-binding transcriptional LysR family regulator